MHITAECAYLVAEVLNNIEHLEYWDNPGISKEMFKHCGIQDSKFPQVIFSDS